MITPSDIRIAQHVVFDSGAASKFRDALKGDQGGRPPSFDQALFLLGMFISARQSGKTHTRLMQKVLTEQIPVEQQFIWGIRRRLDEDREWIVSEADLQNVSRRFKYAVSYMSDIPARFEGDSVEALRRKRVLEELMDLLVDSTLIPRPPGSCDYAIDESGIWANERSHRRLPNDSQDIVEGHEEDTPAPDLPEDSRDPAVQQPSTRRRPRRLKSDARIGVKTSKEGGRSYYFGYGLHALVRVPAESTKGIRPEPPLAERVRLTPAGTDVVTVSLGLIDSLRNKGQKIRHLLADRHYSFKRIDRWLYQLIARGIEQVVQLRETDHRFEEWDGMLFTAGHAHCPATPRHLGEIRQPGLGATPGEWDAFYTKIEERYAYAAERTHRLQPDGTSRWKCPAAAGKIGCPLRAGTVEAARQLHLPIVASPPEHPPAICTKGSARVKVNSQASAVIMKTSQKYYWGSRQQIALNSRRTFVEGWFGTLKGDSAARMKRGSSLYTGIAHASLEATIFACIANIIQLRAWQKETELGDPSHPLLTTDSAHFGYRYLSETEYHRELKRLNPLKRTG